MNSDTKEQFNLLYQAGNNALERGQYRLSVENLEKAIEIYPVTTKQGAEASILLITAYQGVGNSTAAIHLCRQLAQQPNASMRQQGKRLLYILEAPRLKRPPEWVNNVPTLKADSNQSQYVSAKPASQQVPKKIDKIEPIDLSQVKTKDNAFIGLALVIILLMMGAFIWLN